MPEFLEYAKEIKGGFMRNYIELYINGEAFKIQGVDAFMTLSRYLREVLLKFGTKVVCEEGDCGSCTVILGAVFQDGGAIKYRMINSCIAPLLSLDAMHIVTIEGVSKHGVLSEVQEKMVNGGGSQCGYCTPGMVMALTAMFENEANINPTQIKKYVTGNLCRCTGYDPIIQSAMSVELGKYKGLGYCYDDKKMLATLAKLSADPLDVACGEDLQFFAPVELSQALLFKREHPHAHVVGGFTDIGVEQNKKDQKRETILSLSRIKDLPPTQENPDFYYINATSTVADLELSCETHFADFSKYLNIFASPQIKNRATLVGNIVNGSPIADTLPFLYIVDAELEMRSLKGIRAEKIKNLFTGYRQLSIEKDEIVTAVKIPSKFMHKKFFLYKVSKRRDLDIAVITAAFYLEKDMKSHEISEFSMAFGGIGPTVLRFGDIETQSLGKEFSESFIDSLGKNIQNKIIPLSDVRGSSDFRRLLVNNLLKKFYYEAMTHG